MRLCRAIEACGFFPVWWGTPSTEEYERKAVRPCVHETGETPDSSCEYVTEGKAWEDCPYRYLPEEVTA